MCNQGAMTHSIVCAVLKPVVDFLRIILYVDPHSGDGLDVDSEGVQVRLAPLLELRARRLDLADLVLQVRDLTLLGGLLVEQDCECCQRAPEGGNLATV